MKRKKFRNIKFAFCIFIFAASNAFAQWQPDIRLTQDPASSNTSDNNSSCISASGKFIHIVWKDKRDGNEEIYYKKSTDGGTIWSPDKRLTNNYSNSLMPSVSAAGLILHVVWEDFRDGNYEIYYKRSTDAGEHWEDDVRLTNSALNSRNPSIVTVGSEIHITWRDFRDGNYEVYYKHSSDAGVQWSPDMRLTNNSGNSYNPSVTAQISTVHIVWQDNRDGNYEIYVKHSTDNGQSWGEDIRLTNNTAVSYNPVITVSESAMHVVWRDARNGDYDIFTRRSTDNGYTWEPDRLLTHNVADSLVFFAASSGSAVHLVWEDNRDGNYEIYYKHSPDDGVTWGEDERLTNSSGFSFYASAAVTGLAVHVLWYDNRDGNDEIYYKRNLADNLVSIGNNIQEADKEFSLSQNYPNPFNPNTIINYTLPEARYTTLKVYDAAGNEAAVLVDGPKNAGVHSVEFDSRKAHNNLSSGIYFYKIIAGDFIKVKKMTMIK